MKIIFFVLLAFSFNSFASQAAIVDTNVQDISMRSIEYTSPEWADVTLVTFNKTFSGSNTDGCNLSSVYIKPTDDKAMFSALLMAKAQGSELARVALDNAMPVIGGYCKLVHIKF